MLHSNFILRQITSTQKQAGIFVLCVALSVVTLVALSGFSESVNRALLADARTLHAADIIIESSYEFSEPVLQTIEDWKAEGLVDTARTYEFYSVVRQEAADDSLLANIKVVEPGYPFYGEVELASGQPFHEVLRPGNIVVEQTLLERLNLQVGAKLRIGEATLTIQDVVLREPDRPVNFFSLGPRIFIAIDDLESLDLIQAGSRVSYTSLLKVNDESRLNQLAAQLQAASTDDVEQIDTFRTAESGVKRFFDDFLFFLSLIAIFTLLLAGIGIQSALTAFLKEKDHTIAVVKTMGATGQFITTHYLAVVVILGLSGTLLGLTLGFLLQQFFPILFREFLPPNVQLLISGRAVLESLILGFFVVGSFTFLPLYRLQAYKPSFIFRREISRIKGNLPYYLTLLIILLFFIGMVLWQLRDVEVGLYFVFGVLALVLITALLTELTLSLLKRSQLRSLPLRQALRGLFRPRNATRAIIITLAASLAVIFAIFLIERNLDATFIQSYPEDAPNLFFLDIQPNQRADFAQTLGLETTYFPVVRATISEINGVPIDREAERERDGDNLARQFPLTYRAELLEGERLRVGRQLFDGENSDIQVSVLDDMLELHDFQIGDAITFKIQGVPLTAKISSFRARIDENVQPLFSFVFQEAALEQAPQTIFTAVRVERSEIAPLQNRMVARFPNISVIDATQAIASFGETVRKISQVIRFFTLFSIVAGLLIIVSSVFATRFARIQEAVYFKILGAKGRFVLTVFTMENLLLGLVSGLLALFLAQVGSWIISVQVFEIDYRPFWGASVVMVLITMLLVTTVGMVASISILQKRPIIFLQEQNEG